MGKVSTTKKPILDTRENGGPTLLRRWRRARGTSQTDVAKQLKCSQGRYSEYERGATLPSLIMAVKIRKMTGGAVQPESWVAPSMLD